MSFVPTDCLPHLICGNCKKYLSHFPIFFHKEKGSLCGRCTTTSDPSTVRNEIYECLAQTQKFPCCYHSHGCTENLPPNEIPHHEKFCSYKKYDCPTSCSSGCKWQGYTKDLIEHFEQKHPTFFLKDAKFELDFINSYDEKCLMTFGEELFIVSRSSDPKTLTFSCSVSYLGTNSLSKDYMYKVILENERKSHAHVITNNINSQTDIIIERVRDVLNNPSSIIATIEIFENESVLEESNNTEPETEGEEEENKNSDVNYDILKELECVYCFEYMLPPIYQCLTGHSICGVCKNKVPACPTCQDEIKDTQNFALAQVINHITYPCKNRRCKFATRARDIRQHEASCIYGLQKCPLEDYEDCTVELIYSEIYDHVIKSHYESLLEIETVTVPFDMGEEFDHEDGYIIKYGFRLFKLHYSFQNDTFHWAVQLVGPAEESAKYMFDIDIIDNSGKKRRAYFKSPCSPLTTRENAFEKEGTFIDVDYDQIKPMITKDFTYRVRILQE